MCENCCTLTSFPNCYRIPEVPRPLSRFGLPLRPLESPISQRFGPSTNSASGTREVRYAPLCLEKTRLFVVVYSYFGPHSSPSVGAGQRNRQLVDAATNHAH